MSELKEIQGVINGQQFDLYFKDEADKVIAELKGRLNKLRHIRDEGCKVCRTRLSKKDQVIAELRAQKAQAEDDCAYWKTKYSDCRRERDLLKDTSAFTMEEQNERKSNPC